MYFNGLMVKKEASPLLPSTILSFSGCPNIIWGRGTIPSQKISGMSPSDISNKILASSPVSRSGLYPDFPNLFP